MNAKKIFGIFSFALLLVTFSSSCDRVPKSDTGRDAANFISMRERVKITENFWEWKRENVLPMVMREQGVDMWIIRNDEEPLHKTTMRREHPVYTSLLPANHEGMVLPSIYEGSLAELPQILLFHDTGSEIEFVEPKDYAHITQLVRERDPEKIAISMKNLYIRRQNFGNSEQLSIVTSDEMQQALGSKYASRAVDSWHLGILWLSIMGPEQISMYRYVQGVHNDILAKAFSNRVIVPDVTTTDDLNWWLRHKYRDLHLVMDNHPSINVRRRPSKVTAYGDSTGYFRKYLNESMPKRNVGNVIIRRGDIIGCDSGIHLLGLVTDTKHFAYVLQEGETDVPEDLKEVLRIMNEMLDKYRKAYVVGRTKQEIEDAGNKMMPDDPRIIRARFTFHPAQMFIRRFTENGGMFHRGRYMPGIGSSNMDPLLSPTLKLHYNTIYAHEPYFTFFVPGWGEDGIWKIGVEQLGMFTENGFDYLNRGMLEWHVVK